MSFRLVPKSVTLNVLERRNSFLRRKCRPKNVVFNDILFIAIFAEITENECVTEIEAKLQCIILVILLTDRQSVVSLELFFYTA